MFGLGWLEIVLLLVVIISILPRLGAYFLNNGLKRYVSRAVSAYAAQHTGAGGDPAATTVSLSFGSISLRQLADTRLTLCALPISPLQSLEVTCSISSIGWRLFQRQKPISLSVKGIYLILKCVPRAGHTACSRTPATLPALPPAQRPTSAPASTPVASGGAVRGSGGGGGGALSWQQWAIEKLIGAALRLFDVAIDDLNVAIQHGRTRVVMENFSISVHVANTRSTSATATASASASSHTSTSLVVASKGFDATLQAISAANDSDSNVFTPKPKSFMALAAGGARLPLSQKSEAAAAAAPAAAAPDASGIQALCASPATPQAALWPRFTLEPLTVSARLRMNRYTPTGLKAIDLALNGIAVSFNPRPHLAVISQAIIDFTPPAPTSTSGGMDASSPPPPPTPSPAASSTVMRMARGMIGFIPPAVTIALNRIELVFLQPITESRLAVAPGLQSITADERKTGIRRCALTISSIAAGINIKAKEHLPSTATPATGQRPSSSHSSRASGLSGSAAAAADRPRSQKRGSTGTPPARRSSPGPRSAPAAPSITAIDVASGGGASHDGLVEVDWSADWNITLKGPVWASGGNGVDHHSTPPLLSVDYCKVTATCVSASAAMTPDSAGNRSADRSPASGSGSRSPVVAFAAPGLTHTIDVVIVSMNVRMNAIASEWAFYFVDALTPFITSLTAPPPAAAAPAALSPPFPFNPNADHKHSAPAAGAPASAPMPVTARPRTPDAAAAASPAPRYVLSIRLVGMQIAFIPEYERTTPLLLFAFKEITCNVKPLALAISASANDDDRSDMKSPRPNPLSPAADVSAGGANASAGAYISGPALFIGLHVHEFSIDLPREDGSGLWSLPPHPREVFAKVPSRALLVHRAKIGVNLHTNSITLAADAVSLKFSKSLVHTVPVLFKYVMYCLPTLPRAAAPPAATATPLKPRSSASLPASATDSPPLSSLRAPDIKDAETPRFLPARAILASALASPPQTGDSASVVTEPDSPTVNPLLLQLNRTISASTNAMSAAGSANAGAGAAASANAASGPAAAAAAAPDAAPSGNAPPRVRPVSFKGTFNRVVVDFPYCLELTSVAKPSAGRPAVVPPVPVRDAVPPTPRSGDDHSPPVDGAHSFAPATAPTSKHQTPGSPVSMTSRESQTPMSRASAPIASANAVPPRAPLYTQLMSYCVATVEVDAPDPAHWTLSIPNSKITSEGATVLTLQTASLAGTKACGNGYPHPELFHVKASGVRGEWDPVFQLGIFKLIKDCVAAHIDLMRDMFRILYPTLEADRIASPTKPRPEATELLSLLRLKKSYVTAYERWYHVDRAVWLPKPFMLVSLDARDIVINCNLNERPSQSATPLGRAVKPQPPLQFEICVDSFTSMNVPHHWKFSGVKMAFNQHPLIAVRSTEINRVGLNTALVAADPHYTEEEHLLTEYLDLNIACSDVRLDIVPTLDLGPAITRMERRIHALLTAIVGLPSLDTISTRWGGPGYTGPPDPPPPALALKVDDICIEVVDHPLESWLQRINVLWCDERAEQERRSELLQLRIAALRRDGRALKPNAEQHLSRALAAFNSTKYIARVRALTHDLKEGESLKKAPLLKVMISSVLMEMKLHGSSGSFYDQSNVLQCIRRQIAMSKHKHAAAAAGDDSSDDDDSNNSESSTNSNSSNNDSGHHLNVPHSHTHSHANTTSGGSRSSPRLANRTLAPPSPPLGSTPPPVNRGPAPAPSASTSDSKGAAIDQRTRQSLAQYATRALPALPPPPPAALAAAAHAANAATSAGSGSAAATDKAVVSSTVNRAHVPPSSVSALKPGDSVAGRYFEMKATNISVGLRNFPIPLFASRQARIVGNGFMANVSTRSSTEVTPDSAAPVPVIPIITPAGAAPAPPPRPSRTAYASAIPSGGGRETLKLSQRRGAAATEAKTDAKAPAAATVTAPARSSVVATAAAPVPATAGGERVSIGSHTVVLPQHFQPPQIFFDVTGELDVANISFSPTYMYTLVDVARAMKRALPPLPSLQPIVLGDDQSLELTNYLHLLRGIAHGRAQITVSDTIIQLLPTASGGGTVGEAKNYLKIRAEQAAVSWDDDILTVRTAQVTSIQVPFRAEQPLLLQIPQMLLHTKLAWLCSDRVITTAAPAAVSPPGGISSALPTNLMTRASSFSSQASGSSSAVRSPPRLQTRSESLTLPSSGHHRAGSMPLAGSTRNRPLASPELSGVSEAPTVDSETSARPSIVLSPPQSHDAPPADAPAASPAPSAGDSADSERNRSSSGSRARASARGPLKISIPPRASGGAAPANVASVLAPTLSTLAAPAFPKGRMPAADAATAPKSTASGSVSSSTFLAVPPDPAHLAVPEFEIEAFDANTPRPGQQPTSATSTASSASSVVATPAGATTAAGARNIRPRKSAAAAAPAAAAAGASAAPVVSAPAVVTRRHAHRCGLSVSLSIYFASDRDQPPLSCTLQGGVLQSLIKLFSNYAHVPPFPLPKPFVYPPRLRPYVFPETLITPPRPAPVSSFPAFMSPSRLSESGGAELKRVESKNSLSQRQRDSSDLPRPASAASLPAAADRKDEKDEPNSAADNSAGPEAATPADGSYSAGVEDDDAADDENDADADADADGDDVDDDEADGDPDAAAADGADPDLSATIDTEDSFSADDGKRAALQALDFEEARERAARRTLKRRIRRAQEGTEVSLVGLYVERMYLERIAFTMWEASEGGAARGLRLSLDTMYFGVEIREEAGMTEVPSAALRAAKLFIGQPIVNESGIASTRVWSIANLVLEVDNVTGVLVFNDKWRELERASHEKSAPLGEDVVVVHTFENQRYSLGRGWSANNLLPSDRFGWTNETGAVETKKETVTLPSQDWAWESDWQLDFKLRKQGAVDEEGWEYAHDFPYSYSSSRTWYHNVRRRRWIRARKLKGTIKPVQTETDVFVMSVGSATVMQRVSSVSAGDPTAVLTPEQRACALQRSQFRITTRRFIRETRRLSTAPVQISSDLLNFFRITEEEDHALRRKALSTVPAAAPSSGGEDKPPSSWGRAGSLHMPATAARRASKPAEEETLSSLFNLLSADASGGQTSGGAVIDRHHSGDRRASKGEDHKSRRASLNRNSNADTKHSIPPAAPNSGAAGASGGAKPKSSPASSTNKPAGAGGPAVAEHVKMHSVRIVEPKVLITADIRSALQMLADQYIAIILEIKDQTRYMRHPTDEIERETKRRHQQQIEAEHKEAVAAAAAAAAASQNSPPLGGEEGRTPISPARLMSRATSLPPSAATPIKTRSPPPPSPGNGLHLTVPPLTGGYVLVSPTPSHGPAPPITSVRGVLPPEPNSGRSMLPPTTPGGGSAFRPRSNSLTGANASAVFDGAAAAAAAMGGAGVGGRSILDGGIPASPSVRQFGTDTGTPLASGGFTPHLNTARTSASGGVMGYRPFMSSFAVLHRAAAPPQYQVVVPSATPAPTPIASAGGPAPATAATATSGDGFAVPLPRAPRSLLTANGSSSGSLKGPTGLPVTKPAGASVGMEKDDKDWYQGPSLTSEHIFLNRFGVANLGLSAPPPPPPPPIAASIAPAAPAASGPCAVGQTAAAANPLSAAAREEKLAQLLQPTATASGIVIDELKRPVEPTPSTVAAAAALTAPAKKAGGSSGAMHSLQQSCHIQEFFMIEVVRPQVNVESPETGGRIVFVVGRVLIEGRLHWKNENVYSVVYVAQPQTTPPSAMATASPFMQSKRLSAATAVDATPGRRVVQPHAIPASPLVTSSPRVQTSARRQILTANHQKSLGTGPPGLGLGSRSMSGEPSTPGTAPYEPDTPLSPSPEPSSPLTPARGKTTSGGTPQMGPRSFSATRSSVPTSFSLNSGTRLIGGAPANPTNLPLATPNSRVMAQPPRLFEEESRVMSIQALDPRLAMMAAIAASVPPPPVAVPVFTGTREVVDKFHGMILVDDAQALVAPTDIDVSAGVTWASSSSLGLLKPIMRPASLMCTLVYRPSLEELATLLGSPLSEDRFQSVKKEQNQKKTTPHGHASPIDPSGAEGAAAPGGEQQPGLMFGADRKNVAAARMEGLNRLVLQVPAVELRLNGEQFALLVDVLKVVAAPLPVPAGANTAKPNDLLKLMADRSLEELERDAFRVKRDRMQLEWSMRRAEWVLHGLRQQQQIVAQQQQQLAAAHADVFEPSPLAPPHVPAAHVSAFHPVPHRALSSSPPALYGRDSGASLDYTDFGSFFAPISSASASASASASMEGKQHAQPHPLEPTPSLDPLLAIHPGHTTGGALMLMAASEQKELTAMQLQLTQLVTKYSDVSQRFASILLTIRLREQMAADSSVPIANFHVEAYIENLSYEFVRNEKTFSRLTVEGIAASIVRFPDLSGEIACEIRHFSVSDDEAATDPTRPEYGWKQIVQPLSDSKISWNNDNVLLSVHGVKDPSKGGRHIFPHLEVNLFPLNIHVSYDTIIRFVEYFVGQKEKAQKKYEKYKTTFLPLSAHVLNIDSKKAAVLTAPAPVPVASASATATPASAHAPTGAAVPSFTALAAAASASAVLPSSAVAAALAGASSGAGPSGDTSSVAGGAQLLVNAIKHRRILTVALELYHTHRAEAELEKAAEVASAARVTSTPNTTALTKMLSRSLSNSGETGNTTASSSSLSTTGTGGDAAAAAAAAIYHFVYIRLGRTQFVVSYRGNKQNNIEDFEGMAIRFGGFVYQRKLWTIEKLGKRLKRDVIRHLLSQVTDTVGSFLSYKLGWNATRHRMLAGSLAAPRKTDSVPEEDSAAADKSGAVVSTKLTKIFGARASVPSAASASAPSASHHATGSGSGGSTSSAASTVVSTVASGVASVASTVRGVAGTIGRTVSRGVVIPHGGSKEDESDHSDDEAEPAAVEDEPHHRPTVPSALAHHQSTSQVLSISASSSRGGGGSGGSANASTSGGGSSGGTLPRASPPTATRSAVSGTPTGGDEDQDPEFSADLFEKLRGEATAAAAPNHN